MFCTRRTLFRWQASTTEELLPGDLFSLKRSKKHDTVPCDCLLVHGSAVLNEATLTGESVPQMKEGVLASKDGGDEVSRAPHSGAGGGVGGGASCCLLFVPRAA